jgi:hypothetical protein
VNSQYSLANDFFASYVDFLYCHLHGRMLLNDLSKTTFEHGLIMSLLTSSTSKCCFLVFYL